MQENLSKVKKTKDPKSIITVRALCDICKKVDTFDIPTKDLLPHIGGLYQVSTIHHCNDDKDMIMNIVLDRNFAVRQSTISPFVADLDFDRWSPERVNDIKFLVKQIKESDKVVQAVLTGKDVIVAGNNMTFVKRIVRTLELFSPNKFPQLIEWTDKIEKDKKIIGTTLKLANEYNDVVIINLDSNKVINGKQSNYSRIFLDNLINLEPEGMAYAARLKISTLVEFARMLIDLSKEPEIGPKAVDLIKMDVSADALDLILEMVEGFDPSAMGIIKENWL